MAGPVPAVSRRDAAAYLARPRDPGPAPRPERPQAPWRAVQQSAGNQALLGLLRAGPETSRPLPASSRDELEAAFGHDFGDVRLHTGARAAAAARAQGARAWTAGTDIVLGEGRFAPQTTEGKRVLAHELAHVVQQTRTGGPLAAPPAAEAEAHAAAEDLVRGGTPHFQSAAAGIQRDELTDADRRRQAAAHCATGRCHDPVSPGSAAAPLTSADRGLAGPARKPVFSPADLELLRRWVSPPGPAGPDAPSPSPSQPVPVIQPPATFRAPPGIAQLGSRRKVIHVVELVVPEVKIGPLGSTRMFSQADPVKVYDAEIDQPDPSAGYNFDTYLVNLSTSQKIPAQHISGTRFRVFMGTRECPGCHFGHGLEVDLKGDSFVTVLAQGLMNALSAGEAAGLLEGEGQALTSGLRTPADEFAGFQQMLREEGATEFRAAGEPVTMQPHGGAGEAREMLGLTGENQSQHGLPRSVGKRLPGGYDPDAALTTLGEREAHGQMDQPWKDAFQQMRREGRTTVTAQEVYDEVANSIESSTQLSPGMKSTMKLRLKDEIFVEYGLQPGQQLPLPYPNIKPRR